MKLTVLIPCMDEAHNIRECIESVRDVADEILVADSGSTDGTLEIVRDLGGCRIIQREYVNHGNFKNWAAPQATHPWVLIIDSDERLTKKLAAEIQQIKSTGTPPFDAYRIRFQPYFLGHRIRYSGWNTTRSIRFFRKEVCRCDEKRVHEGMIVDSGKIGDLKGKFLHYTCQCLTRYIANHNRYATWSAQDMYDAGRHVTYIGLMFRPLSRFLQFYVLRGGFLDGIAGLAVCMIVGFYTFMKYAKLWELCNAASHRDEIRQAAPSGSKTVRRNEIAPVDEKKSAA